MRKSGVLSEVFGWGVVALVAIFVVVSVILQRVERAPAVSEGVAVGKLEISLSGTTLAEMKAGSKEVKYPGNGILVDGVSLGEVEIKGRGNTTWGQDKRPWQLTFEKRVDLYGVTKAKKWVLLANALDKTHLRNYLAFSMAANILEREFDYGGKMVEVYFDGEYEGLYFLVPKIELGTGAVDLRDRLGVLVELDDLYRDGEWYYSYGRNYLYLKDATSGKDEKVARGAMEKFMADYDALEKATKEKDFAKAAELADLESFAEYYLVNELAFDPDAYFIGFHMYKDGELDKIHAGPVWDFDIAFANQSCFERHQGTGSYTEGSNEKYCDVERILMKRERDEINELIYDLMKMSEFREIVSRVFQERMSGRETEYLTAARVVSDGISEAVERDAAKWGYDFGEARRETEFVFDWVLRRYEVLEREYGGKSADFSAGQEFL